MSTPQVTTRDGAPPPQAPPVQGAAARAPIATTMAAPTDDRARRYRRKFTFPATVRDPSRDPVSVVICELKIGEVEAAYEAGGTNKQRVSAELAKLAIFKVDGRVVSLEDLEVAWPKWSPKVRQQCVLAYGRMHNTSDEEDAAFFDSAEDDA